MTRDHDVDASAVTRLSLMVGDSEIADSWATQRGGHVPLTAELAEIASAILRALVATSIDTSGGERPWIPGTPDERICLACVAILTATPDTGIEDLLGLIGPERSLHGMWAVTAGLLAEAGTHFALSTWEAYELGAALRNEDQAGPTDPNGGYSGDDVETSHALHTTARGVLDALAREGDADTCPTRHLLCVLAGLDPFPDTRALALVCGARADAWGDGAGISNAARYLPPITARHRT
ncbi:MAG: hypothetical protein IT198_01030 [Acidimicrobiia bacterium]|nr:hypothetical protein [Acidimicrobiia bacterium]